MKKFFIGVIIGILLCYTGLAVASSPRIRLIINGQEINTDVPPQVINGRVLVPARFVAEPLGAQVRWDAEKNAVVITSKQTAEQGSVNLPTSPYYTGRQIFEAFVRKYPRMIQHAGGLRPDGTFIKLLQDNEFAFNPVTGSFWFGNKEYLLPVRVTANFRYFSITPLSDAGILFSDDIGPLQ